jgi:hypothetical protein
MTEEERVKALEMVSAKLLTPKYVTDAYLDWVKEYLAPNQTDEQLIAKLLGVDEK